jgi:EF-P beta-lysylation protein EpmB
MSDPASSSWQDELSKAVRDVAELRSMVGLGGGEGDPVAAEALSRLPLKVPRPFVRRMRPGDAADPLLRQVLPSARELDTVPGFGPDPVRELQGMTGHGGPLRKYHGRALILVTAGCGIHCRYCFRRHIPSGTGEGGWDRALEEIAADPSLEEVVLSGGDPLLVDDERLAGLASRLAAIPHLRWLRVHSRLPVVVPQRVEESLLTWLTGTRLRPVMVVHANHTNEVDGDVRSALGRLREAGVTVLNQVVLLRGVNADVQALRELSEVLFSAGVLPYYLHLLDRVQGAAHFEVDEAEARTIWWQLASSLPGYLVPRLVREVVGAPCKVPVSHLRSEE